MATGRSWCWVRISPRRARAESCATATPGGSKSSRVLISVGWVAAALGLEDAHHRRRILRQHRRRANWARHHVAAAIGAAAAQSIVHAFAAERTFERTDHRVRRGWRQILVTAFAIGP